MTETARLVIAVDSTDADQAEKDLNDLGYRAEIGKNTSPDDKDPER
jgi:hypothetical protein